MSVSKYYFEIANTHLENPATETFLSNGANWDAGRPQLSSRPSVTARSRIPSASVNYDYRYSHL